MDETSFKELYRTELVALLDECMNGEEGSQAVLLVHTPAMRTVAIYAVNADMADTRVMLLTAAEPYISGMSSERGLN